MRHDCMVFHEAGPHGRLQRRRAAAWTTYLALYLALDSTSSPRLPVPPPLIYLSHGNAIYLTLC